MRWFAGTRATRGAIGRAAMRRESARARARANGIIPLLPARVKVGVGREPLTSGQTREKKR